MKMLLAALLLVSPAAQAEFIPLDVKEHPDFVALRHKGCISEKDFYYTVYKEIDRRTGSGNRLFWDTSNVGTGWVLRYTAGTLETLVIELYKRPVLALDSAAFPKIAARCRSASDTRDLALCLQEVTHAYMVENDLAPSALLGGKGAMCKLYATYAYGAAALIPAVTNKETVISGWGHVINRIAILDEKGGTHVYMLDPLNTPIFAKLTAKDGSCPEDAPIAKPRAMPRRIGADKGRALGESSALDQLKEDALTIP